MSGFAVGCMAKPKVGYGFIKYDSGQRSSCPASRAGPFFKMSVTCVYILQQLARRKRAGSASRAHTAQGALTGEPMGAATMMEAATALAAAAEAIMAVGGSGGGRLRRRGGCLGSEAAAQAVAGGSGGGDIAAAVAAAPLVVVAAATTVARER
jgi:hypothetical protein